MNVSLTDPKDMTASGPGGLRTFWKRVAQIFDQLVLNRSRDAVPRLLLRRSKHDYDRCRRLMRHGSVALTVPPPNNSSHRAADIQASHHEQTAAPSSPHKCASTQRSAVSNGLCHHGSRGMAKTDR